VSTIDTYQSPRVLTMRVYFHSWRRMRRSAHEALTKVSVQRYHPIQEKEATILVSTLLANDDTANPENRERHFQRTAASAILSILYDYPTLASWQDKAAQDMNRPVQEIKQAAYWMSLVEICPWLLYVPQRSHFTTLILHSYLKHRQVCEVEKEYLQAR
jgi:cytochrome P450